MPCQKLAHEFLAAAIKGRLAHVRVSGTLFFPLHAFYKEVYEMAEGWYDSFSERARAQDEPFEGFMFDGDNKTKGDQRAEISVVLEDLCTACDDAYEEEDNTTRAMIDEARAAVEKLQWQLGASHA
jgi:DNA-binding ferritin-like protein